MKSFNELTTAEKRQLTDEQVLRFIDIDCVALGVPLLPVLPEAPLEVNIAEYSQTYYKVGEWYFKDAGAAQQVADLVKALRPGGYSYVPGPSYQQRYVDKPDTAYELQSVTMLTPEGADKIGGELAKQGAAKKEYDAAVNERNKVAKERSGVEEQIWSEVREQRAIAQMLEHLANELARYVDLAEGNKKLATKMLIDVWQKQYGHDSTQRKALEEWMGVPEEAAAPAEEAQ